MRRQVMRRMMVRKMGTSPLLAGSPVLGSYGGVVSFMEEVTANPSVAPGLARGIGSTAVLVAGGLVTGYFAKVGAANTDWKDLSLVGAAGTFNVTAVNVINYDAAYWDMVRMDASAGTLVVGLPSAVGHAGERIKIKRLDSTVGRQINVVCNTVGELIDNMGAVAMDQPKESLTLMSDGANFIIES